MNSPDEVEMGSTGIFDVDNISDFLAVWLEQDLLSGKEKKVLDGYYYSYKKLFDKYIKFHYSQQSKELMDIIRKLNKPRCLDIGCGCGIETLWMAYRGGVAVTGIDIIGNRLDVARRCKEILEIQINKSLRCSFKKCSLFDIKGENKFDVIWMEQTLHHLEPRAIALDRVSELVKDGGFVIISEVNAWNPLMQAMLLLRRGFPKVGGYIDESGREHQFGEERILTAGKLCKELENRHILKRCVRYFRVLPNKSWARHLAKLERTIPKWLLPLFSHYNYVGQKVSN